MFLPTQTLSWLYDYMLQWKGSALLLLLKKLRMTSMHLDLLKLKLNICLKMYTWKSVCKFSHIQDICVRITISLLLNQLEISRLLTSSPSDIFQREVLGAWAPRWPAKRRNQAEVVRIPKIYQEFCNYSLADDFNIDQIRKTNERLFFKIFIKIDTKPNIKGWINLTNLAIFLPVRVDV